MECRTVPPNLPGWDGVELHWEMTERLPWPAYADPDANVAALAEYRERMAYDVDSLRMITLGTGVGGVIVLGGTCHGLNGPDGEVGHESLILDGPSYNCGARSCLEAYASAMAVTHRTQELRSAPVLQRTIMAAEIAQSTLQSNTVACRIYGFMKKPAALSNRRLPV